MDGSDQGPRLPDRPPPPAPSTANLRTKILDVREFDSSRVLIFRGGIPMSIGKSPESLSQAILVGIILVERLGERTPSRAYRAPSPRGRVKGLFPDPPLRSAQGCIRICSPRALRAQDQRDSEPRICQDLPNSSIMSPNSSIPSPKLAGTVKSGRAEFSDALL